TIFVRRIRATVSRAAGGSARATGRLSHRKPPLPARRGRRRLGVASPSQVRPSRPVPRVGNRARIVHFGGGLESAVVLAVDEDGRRVQVRGEEGEVRELVLSPATARFVSA